jgi:hypothetical protein
MDAFTQKGAVSFLMWAASSFACFAVASLIARRFSGSPKRAYWVRLALMLFCVVAWWGLFFPAIIPTHNERMYYLSPRTVAAQYGMHTIWVWCAIAVVARPKEKKEENVC